MRPIPVRMRQTLERMPRMKMCEVNLDPQAWIELGPCDQGIQWHHVWEHAGRQINEIWAILAGCPRHHGMVKTDRRAKEFFERRSLEIASDQELSKYPNKDWNQLKKYLNVKVIQ